jgi:hypothetical protein
MLLPLMAALAGALLNGLGCNGDWMFYFFYFQNGRVSGVLIQMSKMDGPQIAGWHVPTIVSAGHFCLLTVDEREEPV